MISRHRRGQTETSFQWIFVLVAGIALLLLLLGFARSCTDAGTQQLQQGDIEAAASRLASVAWEGNAKQELSLPDATVECRAGVISLETEGANAQLDRAPVYLPPIVGDDATVITRSIELGKGTPAPFPLGGVAFVLDDRTAYFLVDDTAGVGSALWDTLPASPMIVRITTANLEHAELIDVPGSPRTIVFAIAGEEGSLANVDISRLPAGTEIRGVALQPANQRATFYTSDGTQLVAAGVVPYSHATLGLGMVVTGDREVAWCATAAFATRARMLVRIAEDRARFLKGQVADAACGATLEDVAVALHDLQAHSADASFLGHLFASERDILAFQNILLSRPGSCPGVA